MLRVFFVVVGLVYIGAAASGNAGRVLGSAFAAVFGIVQIVAGVALAEGRRWAYGLALLLVAVGVVADMVVFRLPGLVTYSVFLVLLLAPANRRRWSHSVKVG